MVYVRTHPEYPLHHQYYIYLYHYLLKHFAFALNMCVSDGSRGYTVSVDTWKW